MRIFTFAAALLLAGCTVGPDYHAPKIETPDSYRALQTNAPISTPLASEADLSRWWLQFGDAKMQTLIDRALKSNLDLLIAVSRVREARQQEIVAGASGLPQINASGLAAHVHSNSSLLSKLGGTPPAQGAPPPSSTDIKLYSAGFDATWEIDIFGGVRRGVEAARANTEAAVWQMRDGEVTLTAEIATDYMTLRALQARVAFLREEGQRQTDTSALVEARAKAGFVTQLDVNQQSALASSTAAQIPPLQAQARMMEHAIAVLMGEPPEAMIDQLDTASEMPAVPSTLPAGLPSDLLRRRPDIRVAERNLAAATAQVGVAVADLYPKFDLIAAVSLASNHLSNLLSSDNLGEVGLGSIIWPIFHGGEIHANIQAKKEEEQQAYYAYRKAVLGAVRDAEDALTRYTTDQLALLPLEQSVASGKSSADLALQQYRAGLVTYVNVLSAQSTYLGAQDQLQQARQTLATDLISLYKALGGGWTETG